MQWCKSVLVHECDAGSIAGGVAVRIFLLGAKSIAYAMILMSLWGCATMPTPATLAAARTDPAVTLANRQSSGGPSYREGYFGEGEARLHYVEAGEGPLIILYHGFPSFWYSWFDQMEELKHCYRVVAVDALGAGLSAKPLDSEPYRVERLAAQLEALSQHIAPGDRYILMGHDWGAALSWTYAQHYPERLHQLVVMSAPPYNLFVRLAAQDAEQQARSQYMQRFRAISYDQIVSGAIPATLWQQSYGGIISSGAISVEEGELFRAALSDPRAVNGGMNWYRANLVDFASLNRINPWPGRFASTTVPTLLLWGDDDQTFVPRFLDLAPEYASDLRIVRLPGVGHWTSMQRPELANSAITQFLGNEARCPARG